MKVILDKDTAARVAWYAKTWDVKKTEDAVHDMILVARGRLGALEKYNAKKGKKNTRPKAPKAKPAVKAKK